MAALSPEARALLRLAAASDEPSAVDAERIWRRLQVSAAAGAAAGLTAGAAAASASASGTGVATLSASATGTGAATASVGAGAAAGGAAAASGAALTAKLWLVGALLLAAGVAVPLAGAVAALADGDAASPRGVVPVRAAASAPERSSAGGEPEASPPVEPTPSAASRDALGAPQDGARAAGGGARPSDSLAARRREAPADAPGAPTVAQWTEPGLDELLGAELSLLEEVQRELEAGGDERALELLDRYDGAHGAGLLAEEAAAARAVAQCRAGAGERATVAGEFRRRYPRSPHAARVEASCASDDVGGPHGSAAATAR